MEFAVHMRNEKTGEEWMWKGTEPFHNVSENVKHIGNGFYVKL